jgi:hypothetical protein
VWPYFSGPLEGHTRQAWLAYIVMMRMTWPQVLVDRTHHPPFLHPTPFFHFFFFHFHGLEICKTALIWRQAPAVLPFLVFCFIQKLFFGHHELEHLFFFVAHSAKFFFPEFNIRLYDKKLWIRLFFFPSTKIRIFFSATLGIRIYFLEKTITPLPCKLNGPSLTVAN